MNILIFGAKGQVGMALTLAAQKNDISSSVYPIDHAECDITNSEAVEKILEEYRSKLGRCMIVNAAGWTQVDDAEERVKETFETNWRGPLHLAQSAEKYDHDLIQLSTDYVFDGMQESPYTEDDFVNPLSIYGLSKEAGERAVRASCNRHIILRTSWIFSLYGKSFTRKIIELAEKKDELTVVTDQIGSPTSASDLAHAILKISSASQNDSFQGWGTYHYAGAPSASWYEVACFVMTELSKHNLKSAKVIPATSADFKTKAPRPAKSILSCNKIYRQFSIQESDWKAAIRKEIKSIAAEKHD